MCCFGICTSQGRKQFQATPTRQDLGISNGINERRVAYYYTKEFLPSFLLMGSSDGFFGKFAGSLLYAGGPIK